MSGSLLLLMVLALVVFWGVGLYNRLMRIRARSLSALGSVEKHMRVYADMVRDELANGATVCPHSPIAETGPDDWECLLSALHIFEDALKDAGTSALRNEAPARLGRAFDDVQAAWRRLNEAPPDLAGPLVPATMRTQWDGVTQRVETARGGFNQILTHYNEAVAQFPARLVAGALGFKPGSKL
jgi:LemA protein